MGEYQYCVLPFDHLFFCSFLLSHIGRYLKNVTSKGGYRNYVKFAIWTIFRSSIFPNIISNGTCMKE